MTSPIIINDWQSGMADHPILGNGLLKNVVIKNYPGSVMPTYAATYGGVSTSSAFTAAVSDLITLTDKTTFGFGNVDYVAVTVSSSGTLPAGLAASTYYFVKQIDFSAGTLKLATSIANVDSSTFVNITDTGTGTHTMTTVPFGTVQTITQDPISGVVYAVDSNGRVWFGGGSFFQLLPGNTLTNAAGKGLQIFRVADGSATYLLVFRNALIDVMNITTSARRADPVGTSSWTNSWQSLNSAAGSGNSHTTILGQDNIIYFCDDRWVGSLREVTTFDPSSSATYTFNNQALRLPQGEVAEWLEELGLNLLTAGRNTNKIYPWDRTSSSFALPLNCAENGIYRLKNINNIVYALVGTKGNIYKTNGTSLEFMRRLPEHLLSSATVTWGGIDRYDGDLIFGAGQNGGGSNYGLWRMTASGVLTIENQPYAGSGIVYGLVVTSGNIYMGSAGALDYLDSNRYNNFQSVVRTPMLKMGTKTKPGKISEIELQINNAIGSGPQMRVSYRTNMSASFTTITTFSMSTSTTSYKTDAGLTNLEYVQIQVEMSGSGSDTSALQLNEIRLIP